jgi:DNA invertase Pin-like site-specific DNA recombinase
VRSAAYIRVSKTRDGGQSAEEQRAAIEARAKADGATLVAEVVEEDVSGGKSARLRRLNELVEAAERGELSTIYVLDFSRLTREHPYRAMEPLARLLDVGGRVVGIHDGFDSASQMGAQTAGVLAGQAYQYRETVRQRWQAAKERAISDGRVVGRAPVGYLRGDDGRLTPDPATAPAITAAFEMRAAGAALREVGDFLEAQGVRSSVKSSAWAWQSLKDLLSRRVYLGELRLGQVVNVEAHEALVDLPTWQAAQAPPSKPRRPKTGGDLLTGLIRCASCGYSMSATTRSDGVRVYRCVGGRRGGKCPAPATIRADEADFVATMVAFILARQFKIVAPQPEQSDLAGMRQALLDAQRRLVQAQAEDVQEALGHDAWVAMLAERRRVADEAAATLGRAEAEAVVEPPDERRANEVFKHGSPDERRALLTQLFDTFAITRDKEVVAFPRGTAPDDLPRQGVATDGLRPLGEADVRWDWKRWVKDVDMPYAPTPRRRQRSRSRPKPQRTKEAK